MEGGGLQFAVKRRGGLRRQGAGLAHERIQGGPEREDALFPPPVIPRSFAGACAQYPIACVFASRTKCRIS